MVYGATDRGVAMRCLERALDLIVPNPCFVCFRRRASRHGLCPVCRGQLRPVPRDSCPTCGRRQAHRPPPRRDEGCTHCMVHPPLWEALVAPWSYEPPVDGLLQALKFGRREVLGPLLGDALAEEVGHRLAGHELVAYVPLHRWSRLRRGYDQAELIAGALARRLGLPLHRPLRRLRSTPPQVGLDRRHRRSNVAGAFRCTARGGALVVGRRVILVDDVVTTGSTVAAACRALLRAGARSITVVAVARSPAD